MAKKLIITSLVVAGVAQGALLFSLPHLLQAIAALLLVGMVPGVLFVEALIGQGDSPPHWLERIIYSVGAAYVLAVALLLLLSYLPGGLRGWQIFVAVDALILGLAGWLLWRSRSNLPAPAPGWQPRYSGRWLAAGALVLLIAAGLMRFVNLGYTDFQGDEARAALRAAAVLQGYEDVLFLHKKGPSEILLPTAIYGMTGHLSETSARLPFALASLAGLFAVWLLGWRLFNPLAGWVAALFFAFDGYFIGFARIVQYQSVVFLMTVLVVLVVFHAVRQPRALTAYLTLAALFLATGVLSHYEGALALIPATFLWVALLRQNRAGIPSILKATVVSGLVGGALALAFYLPFVLSPDFGATFAYLSGERVGGEPPYNNLVETFMRTTLYSTTYAILLLIMLTVAAMIRAYWRSLSRPWALIFSGAAVALAVVTFWQPDWLQIGDRDWIFAPFLLLLGIIILLPRQPLEERVIWLWFGAIAILALFFTAKPRTHVYTFFIPWFLLCGFTSSLAWLWLRRRIGQSGATWIGVALAGAGIFIFGFYAYRLFVSTDEVMLEFPDRRPAGYWTFYAEPDDRSLFGFPLQNGWKAVGVLYAEGALDGSYTTNEINEWVGDWYTRGAERCPSEHRYLVVGEHLKRDSHLERVDLLASLPGEYQQTATVLVDGQPRIEIWDRSGAAAPPITVDINALAPIFDARLSGPDFPLLPPTILPPMAERLDLPVVDAIRLEGYTLDPPSVRPDEMVDVTLFWRSSDETGIRYRVVVEALDSTGRVVAMTAGEPDCAAMPTDDWPVGELVVDRHRLDLAANAAPGWYDVTMRLEPIEDGDTEMPAPVTLGQIEVAGR